MSEDYVLGLLDGEELRQFEYRLERDKILQREVAYWREMLLPLDETAISMTPSSGLWEKIDAATPVKKEPRSILGYGIITAIAASLVFAFLPAIKGILQPRTGVAILVDDAAKIGAIVEIYGNSYVKVIALTEIDVPADKSLQVWTLQTREVGPLSLGLMENIKGGDFKTPLMPKPIEGQLYEITLEPKGGSPQSRPTGKILYKGNASLL